MKRFILLGTFMILFSRAFSQTNVFPGSGNVGIGIATPDYLLQINSNQLGTLQALKISTYDGTYNPRVFLNYVTTRNSQTLEFNSSYSTNTGYANFSFLNGYLGIGTSTPSHTLDIAGDGINLENTTYANQHGIVFKNGSPFISDFNYGDNGSVTTIGDNTFMGINAGNFTMGGTATSALQASYNTAVGYKSFYSNTTGYSNTALGFESLCSDIAGFNNIALGFESLLHNTTGNYNTANGSESLNSNTAGNNNTALGYYALAHNTTASDNTALGYAALAYNTTGIFNTAAGYEALEQNTVGNNNAVTGYASLYRNTSGTGNSGSGFEALFHNTSGNYNAANGYGALLYNTNGDNDVASGYEAGSYTAGGSAPDTGSRYSVFLGSGTTSSTPSDNNEIVIGYNAAGAGSNSVVLGNTAVKKTLLQGNVLIGKTSQSNSSYKLDVNGNIRANQVTVNATGADYVFDSTYKLPPLMAVEGYIKHYHHLPGISSAGEMKKKGLNIGTNQTMLLQKIEELTLYIIAEDKENHQLQEEVDSLKTEVNAFKKQSQ